ncbi:MAG: heme exporter protein CcmB [Proteobacteria bacterium]|nr:heme exporter protein CcmB [Pseudomonadota bacterium]
MKIVWAILWKDLVTEWRRRDRVVAMALFTLLVVVVFHFSLPEGATAKSREVAPGLLWVAYVFAAVLGLNRAFALELENDALSGLAMAPGDRGFVFLGKAVANFVLIGLVQAATAAVFAVVFELPLWPVALPLAGVIALGSVGLCSVGTLFSAMAARTRFREVLLPVLLLPTLFPVLAGAVRATAGLLESGEASFQAIQLLIVVDGIYLIVSFLTFEAVLDE